jgi:hypothetical protein
MTMAYFYPVKINTTRNLIASKPPESRVAEARGYAKIVLVPFELHGQASLDEIPDDLVTEDMAQRYLEIHPPWAAVVPEFQRVIEEIETSYVVGNFFSAIAASCGAIERMLNVARIRLHKHHKKIKELWSRGPINDWAPNVAALKQWGYLSEEFAGELVGVYRDVRCKYLHSGELRDLDNDALRSVRASYELLSIFIGFPSDLFTIADGAFRCVNLRDPRYIEFYRSRLVEKIEEEE